MQEYQWSFKSKQHVWRKIWLFGEWEWALKYALRIITNNFWQYVNNMEIKKGCFAEMKNTPCSKA